ncbi:CS domain-containing protein [Mycena kentingensis (nom. inval.)]|nr:CS domain-containing protein [Mycena kentingensis (nom. inval.)]
MLATNRSLVNPHFEGYKLEIAPYDAVVRCGLQYPVTQSTVSTPLSFEEVHSRITHNHLASAANRVVYVDAHFRVILVRVEEGKEPVFTAIYELAQPTGTRLEYPSATFFSDSEIFVADGAGLLYLLRDSGDLIGMYQHPEPFRIHAIATPPTGGALLVLSARHHDPTSLKKIQFDVCAAKFSLPLAPQSDIAPLDIVWLRRGTSVPIAVSYDASRRTFLILGECSYTPISLPSEEYTPTPSELAPIPRAGESLPKAPPPYSWTQTSDSVTVAIPLPASTRTADISVHFTAQALTVHIKDAIAPDVPLPHYTARRLWAGIATGVGESLWTWDRAGEKKYGVLTLHLEKRHEGTRWAHVFEGEGAEGEEEVPETLDPSELYAIRESLEKYTAALRTGDDASGMGLGSGIPSLARGEVDEDVDDSVGRNAQITWIRDEDAAVPPWASQSSSLPGRLLSTVLPGAGDASVSIIVKNGLDGTVFALQPASDPEEGPIWTHTSTYSALAFVLASKTDTRFTYHVPGKAALGFENGQRGRAGNAYIYRAAPVSTKWAKQTVLRVGEEGSLLGVAAVQTPTQTLLVGLTEKEFVVLRNIPALQSLGARAREIHSH